MFRTIRLTLFTAFFSKNAYGILNWILVLFILLTSILRIFGSLGEVEDVITLTSQAIAFTSSILYSTIGIWSKNNLIRIYQGYGIKCIIVYLTTFVFVGIVLFPYWIILTITSGADLSLLSIAFVLYSNLAMISGFIVISRKTKSIRSSFFLTAGFIFPLTTMLSLYGKTSTEIYSLFYWIGILNDSFSWVIYFIAILALIFLLFIQSKKINKINWNKWSR